MLIVAVFENVTVPHGVGGGVPLGVGVGVGVTPGDGVAFGVGVGTGVGVALQAFGARITTLLGAPFLK
jgi:hypothetical protein